MGYLVIQPSGKYLRYTCTNTYEKPRLYVNGNYIPLLVKKSGSLTVKGNRNTYKVGELSTYTAVGTLTNVSTLTNESYLTRESTSSSYTESSSGVITVPGSGGTSQASGYSVTGSHVESGVMGHGVWTYDNGETGTQNPNAGGQGGGHAGGASGSTVWETTYRTVYDNAVTYGPVETWYNPGYTTQGVTTLTYYLTRQSTYSTIYNTYTSGIQTITTGTTYYTRSSIYGSSSSSSSTTYTTSMLSTTGGEGIDIGDYPWGQTGISDDNVVTYKTYSYSSTFTVQTTIESSTSTSYDLTRSSTSNTVYGTRTTNGTYIQYHTTWV